MDYAKIPPKLMVLEKIRGGEPLSIVKDVKEPDYADILKQIEDGEISKEKIIEEEAHIFCIPV